MSAKTLKYTARSQVLPRPLPPVPVHVLLFFHQLVGAKPPTPSAYATGS